MSGMFKQGASSLSSSHDFFHDLVQFSIILSSAVTFENFHFVLEYFLT